MTTEHLDMATLSAYLDDELASAERALAETHLGDCPHCRATLAELEVLGQGLRALACPEPPAELRERLRARFEPAPRPARRWLQTLSAAAAVLLGLLIGNALPGQPPAAPGRLDMLAVLGSAPPGALCAQPELCYLKVNRP